MIAEYAKETNQEIIIETKKKNKKKKKSKQKVKK